MTVVVGILPSSAAATVTKGDAAEILTAMMGICGGRGRQMPVRRLALSPDEAASSPGASRDFFDEHIGPDLRVVRRGRRRLIAIRELERWLAAAASIPLADEL